ncbi:MAG: sensor histidine kinase [Tissierellia bacterium]|nr:sensor histidine kinase [Tissierellia bacterium]
MNFIFPIYHNFIVYFAIVFSMFYLLMFVLSMRNSIKDKNLIKEWIDTNKDIKLPDEFYNRAYIKEIERLNNEVKSYKEKVTYTTNELKDYITIWTHQIKSPIFALNLLLDDSNIDRDASKNELFEIEEYVDNILGFVRMDSKSTDYSFSVIDVDKEVSSSIKKYARQIIQKKNNIEFKKTNLKILSDSKWFRFIIDQILSNANKYTKNGKIEIYSTNHSLIIKDSGIGIRKEDLPRLFEKGYTGFNGRLDKKATGIGLNLVKNISNHLRIDVSIESRINIGTKVILDLDKNIEE